MADFGLIKPVFWDGDRRGWSDAEYALSFYLMTCRHRNLEGFYQLPKGYAVTDLGWDLEKVTATLSALIGHGFCDYDETVEVVFVRKSLKHQQPKGPARIKGAVKSIRLVPSTHLLGPFYEACRTYAPDLWEALERPSGDGLNTPTGPSGDGRRESPETPNRGSVEVAHPETETETDAETEAKTEEEERARIAAGIAAGHLHPRLLDVLDVFAQVKAAHSAFQVEEMAIDSACKAKPDGDHVGAAHSVASWVHAGTARRLIASVLLAAALDQQRETNAKVKAAGEQPARRPTPSAGRRLSAKERAAEFEAKAEQLRAAERSTTA